MDSALKDQIVEQGMNPETVAGQIENFKNGFPFLKITAPATPGDGIQVLSTDQLDSLIAGFPALSAEKEMVKFVPASGAASRMFKSLFAFLDGDGDISKDAFVEKFMNEIKNFAFYKDLNAVLESQGSSISQAIESGDFKSILAALLNNDGLSYGTLPKGLLKFHKYKEGNRTPAYEHMIEGVQYALGKGNLVKIHFTVSPEHEAKFKEEIESIQSNLESEFEVKFDISYSQQKKSTDTIAVDMDNNPFEEDGKILFRPAGHGALLENLDDINADVIFIKNIDNVVPDSLKHETKKFKMAIGALLLQAQSAVFEALNDLDSAINQASIAKAKAAFTDTLGAKLPSDFDSMDEATQARFLKEKLNRPVRVCGMVKNTGEPGGGPFWIMEDDGSQSLQILETAQINMDDEKSKVHLQNATHFNPVDLVCGTRNYKGESFDLLDFRDMKTGFITEKSKSGRDLKALELPGLWNGSMAGWNTIFVEVPLITFNPVKTVNDLLRDEHQ